MSLSKEELRNLTQEDYQNLRNQEYDDTMKPDSSQNMSFPSEITQSFNFTEDEIKDIQNLSQEDYVALKKMAASRDAAKLKTEQDERKTTLAQRQTERQQYEVTMRRLEAEEAEREAERDRIENPRSPYADYLDDLKNPASNNYLNMDPADRRRRIKSYAQADKDWRENEGARIKAEAKQKKLDADSEVKEMRAFWDRFQGSRLDAEEKIIMGELLAYVDAGAHKQFWSKLWEAGDKAYERRSKELKEKREANQAAQNEISAMTNELKELNDKRQTVAQKKGK